MTSYFPECATHISVKSITITPTEHCLILVLGQGCRALDAVSDTEDNENWRLFIHKQDLASCCNVL